MQIKLGVTGRGADEVEGQWEGSFLGCAPVRSSVCFLGNQGLISRKDALRLAGRFAGRLAGGNEREGALQTGRLVSGLFDFFPAFLSKNDRLF